MYLTAQHVRSEGGQEDLHAYLHLHDVPGSEPFPADWTQVPMLHPGKMVRASHPRVLKAGGNGLVAYLDIVATDAWWMSAVPPGTGTTAWWYSTLDPIGELVGTRPLPWSIAVRDINVLFNASPSQPAISEYESLVRVAMQLWEDWRASHGLP